MFLTPFSFGNMSCTSSTNGAPCPQPTYNVYNQVTGYQYDAAGHVLNDGTHTYTWDGEGRLSSVRNGYTGTFTYNAEGWVTEQTGSAGGGYTEDTLRDPTGQVLAVRDGPGYFSNIWANGRIIGQYNQGSSPETYFHHLNNIGSTGVLTDHTGAVTEDLLYYPWGQVWASQGSMQDMHFAAFEGVYPDLGLNPTPTRMYPPIESRWLSPDPGGINEVHLDDPQSWNMYAYVRNNPVTLTDPTGLTTPGTTNCSGTGSANGCNQPAGDANSPNGGAVDDNTGQNQTTTVSQQGLVQSAAIGAVVGAVVGGVVGSIVGGTAGSLAEPGGGTVGGVIIGGTEGAKDGAAAGAAAGVIFTQSKDALDKVAQHLDTALVHLGKLANFPDQDPRNKWKQTVRKSADNIDKQADKIANKNLSNTAHYVADLLRGLVN
jgi:RHS repeat-associated protein